MGDKERRNQFNPPHRLLFELFVSVLRSHLFLPQNRAQDSTLYDSTSSRLKISVWSLYEKISP